ncbi:Redoxin [Crateriforma conspicua]|nr:Redoxin [Crateriforma conspicua]
MASNLLPRTPISEPMNKSTQTISGFPASTGHDQPGNVDPVAIRRSQTVLGRSRRIFLAWCGMTMLAAGCGQGVGDGTADNKSTSESVANTESATDASKTVAEPAARDETASAKKSEPEIRYEPWPAIEKRIQTGGKITVVDFWSLSCEPCLRELPALAELARERDDEFDFVAIAVDFDGRLTKPPETYEPKIRAVLTALDATFESYLCETASDTVFQAIDIPSIPAVFVYGADGKLLKKFVDTGDTAGFTYHDDVIPYLDELTSDS